MGDISTWLVPVGIIVAMLVLKKMMMGAVIDGQTARKLVEEGAMLVDVRTPGEYAGGHIKGAVNVPLDQISSRVGEFPKDRKIVLYCRSGARSGQARSMLKAKGFEDVLNLGPMSAW